MSPFAWLKRRRPDDDDLQEELRAHLAIAAADRMADGVDPQRAERAARKDFGNLALTAEDARSAWTPRWLEIAGGWHRDATHAVRVLARNPAFSLTVIVVLTLGISLNAAIFTLLKSLSLTPLAGVANSGGLSVVLQETSAGRRAGLSYPDYQYLRANDRAFSGLIGATSINVGLENSGGRIMAEFVTGNYFQQLGVPAQLGRTILPADEAGPGQHQIVVVSDGLWRRAFAADPDIVGRTIRLNAFPLTVVGVADPSFHGSFVSFDVEAFVPITMAPFIGQIGTGNPLDVLTDRQASFVATSGWLRPGVTRAEALTQIGMLQSQLQRERPIDATLLLNVLPIWRSPFGAQTYMLPAVFVLSVMAALLLLIVCANVAALMLARGVSRRGELALRLALGASRARIMRLLLIESGVLAIPAALLALALAPAVTPFALSGITAAAPVRIFFNLSVDGAVILFSMLITIATVIAFGLVSAVHGTRVDLLSIIKADLSPRGAARGRFRMALVASQVAVSLLLLIGAGLLTRSVAAARDADPGFDPTNVVSMRIDLKPHGYDDARGRTFYSQLLSAVRGAPGIESATIATTSPLTLVDDGARETTLEGYQPARDEDLTFLSNVVAPAYFHTLRIGVVAGREFEDRDDLAARPVAIVNETMARRFWGDPTNALGRRLRVPGSEWRTVIGVVRDSKYSRLNEAARPYVYLPFLQMYEAGVVLHAKGGIGSAALIEQVRTSVRTLDPELPLLAAGTLREQSQREQAFLGMAADMLFIFGAAGLALAAMGIFGLVAYTVKQATHEIGIRMALGAGVRAVVWQFLRRGLRLGAVGAVAGMVTALALTRLLGAVLYGVSPTDPISFTGAFVVVAFAVAVASIIPAWRAARANPLAALRQQ